MPDRPTEFIDGKPMPAAKIESINNSAITPNDGSRALGQRQIRTSGLGSDPALAALYVPFG